MAESVCARKLEEMDDLDENIMANDPWSQLLLTTILSLTKKAVLNWLSVVQKIGDSDKKNEQYGYLLIDNLTSLYEDLILDMEMLREKILDKLVRSMQTLEQLCKDLQLLMPEVDHEHKPLAILLNELEANVKRYEEMMRERVKIIADLNNQVKLLCGEFGRKPDLLPEQSPLPTTEQINLHKQYIKQLVNERNERIDKFHHLHGEILQFADDLDYQGRTNFERFILSTQITDADYQIIMKDKEMEKIIEFHNDLGNLKRHTSDEIETIRETISKLWNVLEYDICERDLFTTKWCKTTSLKTLESCKIELNRLELMKKENMKKFIEQQRADLQELWLKCNLTEQQQQEFRFFYSDCYTEDLYDLHQCELHKWQQYYDENKTILMKLHEYRQLWQEYQQLLLNNDSKDRYKNRGGQLLIEEKLRNKLMKKLAKLENDLNQFHHDFMDANNGRVFLTFGQNIPEYLQSLHCDLDKRCKDKLSARKLQREQTTTTLLLGTKSRMNLFPSTSNLLRVSPSPGGSAKRKLMATPRTGGAGVGGGGGSSVKKLKNSPKKKPPTLNVSHKRRSSKKLRNMKKKKQTTGTASSSDSVKENNGHDTSSTEYGDFANDLSKKHTIYRSTTFQLKDNVGGGGSSANIETPKKTPFSMLPHGSRLNTKF